MRQEHDTTMYIPVTAAVIESGVFIPADSDAALPPFNAPCWAARPARENPFIGVAVRADGKVLTTQHEPDELILGLHAPSGAAHAELRFPAPDDVLSEHVIQAFQAAAEAWFLAGEPPERPEPPAPSSLTGTHAILAIRRDHPTPEAFPFGDADLRVQWLEFLAYADDTAPGNLLSYTEWLDAELEISTENLPELLDEEPAAEHPEVIRRYVEYQRRVRAELRHVHRGRG